MSFQMHRRQFLTTLSASALLPCAGFAYAPVPYAPSTWREMRDNGDKVVLNFRASWSLTCQMKLDILEQLLSENPPYQTLTFLDIDWDNYAGLQWTERLKVKRNSTLIAMKGKTEIARVVNEPFERSLRRLLDAALEA